MKQEITQELIRELFEYKNGELYNKIYRSSNAQIGNKAGRLNSDGYCHIKINYKIYKTHRLIFLYFNGYLPEFIDHIDNNRSNNKIENLREATRSQNGMNKKSYKNTSSKYKGVYWRKDNKKWRSHITINSKRIYLGHFESEKDAAIAYNNAAIKYFGKFVNLNDLGDD